MPLRTFSLRYGLSWRFCYKASVKYFLFVLLVFICYQVIQYFSDSEKKSLKVPYKENENNSHFHGHFSNLLTSNETNESNFRIHQTTQKEIINQTFFIVTEQLETNDLKTKSIQDVCFSNSITNIKTLDLSLEAVSKFYVKIQSNLSCYRNGTEVEKTRLSSSGHCLCLKYYYGPNCDIPAAVWHSTPLDMINTSMNIRNISKRVINGFLFNHEFDMLEARLHELADVVDVFVILECSFTSYGEKKPLRFYERFEKGYLKEFSHKIIHVHMDMIPNFKNFQGHDVDRLLRCYLTRHGLARIKGTLEDDIFIISDADEILSADVVGFLKVYDVLTPAVDLTYKWNIYGFFWKNALTTDIVSVTSLKYLKNELNYYASVYRNVRKEKFYMKIGTAEFYAGWHCSWCFSPEGIVLKMNSAHGADPPRLGDDPTKKNLTFIEDCIKHGRYFYDAPPFIRCNKADYMYAPKYLMEHAEKYKTILEAP